MIQMLTYGKGAENFEGRDMVINTFHDAQSLDEFEINIINLNSSLVWKNTDNGRNKINAENDLRSLSSMIHNSMKTQIIIMFPQNMYFEYYYYGGRYTRSCELKDMLMTMVKEILFVLHSPLRSLELYYENTKTKIGLKEIEASFHFSDHEETLLKSIKSDKATTIKRGEMILTTLNFKGYDDIIDFLSAINLLNKNEEMPQWAKTIKMFDDNDQLAIIEDRHSTIQKAEEDIEKAQNVLDKNNKYKSILYTKGDELVNVVFEIIEQMFGCDLSNFEDKYDEDFLFQAGGFTFIGEIKGVTPNVKNDNISQIDRHCQNYVEEYEEEDGRIKGLLIINHQRNKPLQEREPVHERQISLAERYEVLIIETPVLLKLFEKYCSGELSREKWLETVKENTGLLHVEDIF